MWYTHERYIEPMKAIDHKHNAQERLCVYIIYKRKYHENLFMVFILRNDQEMIISGKNKKHNCLNLRPVD